MQENEKREQILIRIKKLLKQAESCKNIGSLQEAEVFALKANELLAEYNLTLLDIKWDEDDENRFKNMGWSEYVSYKDNQSGSAWRINLVSVLTKHNLCSYIYTKGQHKFKLYGNMQNVDTVVWLYNFLTIGLLQLAQQTYVSLSKEEKKRYNRYAFLKDFLLGAVRGIEIQLKNQRKQMQEEQVTALILYNDKALQSFLEKEMPDIKTSNPTRPKTVDYGYLKGIEAGKQYKIIKDPLQSTKETSLLE